MASTFGGGFELALTCDLIVADKMARFCFPELRLGLIPGFGGIPRLKRDLGNAVVRDLLLTGRSINADEGSGRRPRQPGGGRRRRAARGARHRRAARKFDRETAIAAEAFHQADSRTTSCGAKSKSSAIFSRGRRSKPACANSSKAPTRCPICPRPLIAT